MSRLCVCVCVSGVSELVWEGWCERVVCESCV